MFAPLLASAQIDPVKRDLIQLGYNAAFEGHAPLAGYAFFYHNQPDFLGTNLTLRLAVAPVYLDSELGFVNGLGPHTDFAIGVAGGGFADSYNEIRGGTYYPSESFDGNGGEISASVYHLFNPGDEIPLNFVLRGTAHYSFFNRDDNTAANFQLPDDHGDFSVRTGLRWGGVEPTLFPPLAMELSVWYEGHLRSDSGVYGFGGDRELKEQSHLFWAEAALAYTLPKSQQSFYVRLTAGTSVDADRFSAYRLGGFLPLVAEFPLSLPGYFYQEISARQFVLLNANYLLPLDPKKCWNLDLNAASAFVDYLPGESQPGNWLNGVGRRHPVPLAIATAQSHGQLRLRRGCHPLAWARRQQHRGFPAIGPGASAWPGLQSGASQPRALARVAMALRQLKSLARGPVAWFIMKAGAHMVELADTLL